MKRVALAAEIRAELALPHDRWVHPVLVALFGLPGAGKTEIARYLAHHHPLLMLSTDALRLRYGLESGLYTRQVMDELALQLLPQRISLIFDGIHLGRRDRLGVLQLAQSAGATTWLIHVTALPEVIEQRLQARMAAPDTVAAEGKFVISPKHFQQIANYFEPPSPDEQVICVDTSANRVGDQLDELDAQLHSCLQGAAYKVSAYSSHTHNAGQFPSR